jgi:hypothetical protein
MPTISALLAGDGATGITTDGRFSRTDTEAVLQRVRTAVDCGSGSRCSGALRAALGCR